MEKLKGKYDDPNLTYEKIEEKANLNKHHEEYVELDIVVDEEVYQLLEKIAEAKGTTINKLVYAYIIKGLLKEIDRMLNKIDRIVNLTLNDKRDQKKLKKLARKNKMLIRKLLDKIDEYTQLKHTILKNNHNIIRLLKKL